MYFFQTLMVAKLLESSNEAASESVKLQWDTSHIWTWEQNASLVLLKVSRTPFASANYQKIRT